MKKASALVLSVIMLICSINFAPLSAAAYSKDDAPDVTEGVPFEVSVLAEDMNDVENRCIFAKFTPEQTAFYEFSFAQKFNGTVDDSMIVYITESGSDDMLSIALCTKITKKNREYAELLGVSENPSVATKMTAGKTYLLYILTTVAGGYTSDVTVQKHTHKTKLVTDKSYVDSESFKYNYNGEKYYCCTNNNCSYHKRVETYYRVKSVKLSGTAFTYTGKAKKPKATVITTKGKKLKQGTDYTISYSGNVKIGTAKATIKFKGKYTGKVVRKFKINPVGTSLTYLYPGRKSFAAYWKRKTADTNGYQLQYSTDKNFKKNTKTVTVKSYSRRYKTIGKLKAKKKYFVRVRTYKKVGKTVYYSKWSKVKSVKTK